MRLGKRERAERKGQYALVKAAKLAVITENVSNLHSLPTSKGFRLSPQPKQGYAVRIHWSGMGTGQKGHKVSTGGKSAKFIPDKTWNPKPTSSIGLAPDGKKVGKAPRLPAGTGSYRR